MYLKGKHVILEGNISFGISLKEKAVSVDFTCEYWRYTMLLCSVYIQSTKLGSVRILPMKSGFTSATLKYTLSLMVIPDFQNAAFRSCEILDYIQHIQNNKITLSSFHYYLITKSNIGRPRT